MPELRCATCSYSFFRKNSAFYGFLGRGLGETALWPPKSGFPQKYFYSGRRRICDVERYACSMSRVVSMPSSGRMKGASPRVSRS